MRREPALDGLRGAAALAVVVYHTTLGGYGTLGAFGVDIFFALSGFLCGSLLLEGQPWQTFYLRRAARVLPLYFLAVAFSLWFPWGLQYPAWSLWTLNADWAYATHGARNYALSEIVLWSVAVEVHAYLLLPWVVRQRRLLWLLICLACFARIVCLTAEASGHFDIYSPSYCLTICRLDAILLGVLLAHWRQERSPVVGRLCRWAPALLLLRSAWVVTYPPDAVGLILPFIHPWCSIAIVAWVVSQDRVVWLENRLLVWLGSISYGVYLIHGFKVNRLHGDWGLLQTLQWTLPLAALLHYCFEDPIRRWASRVSHVRAAATASPSPVSVEAGG